MRLLVVGSRPEVIKMAPIIKELERRKLSYFVWHTNQHYDDNMNRGFFEELALKQPDFIQGEYKLGVTIDKLIKEISDARKNGSKFEYILAEGDTNSVLVAAIVAKQLRIPFGHVEAGLRSKDERMIEEHNRIVVDHISDWCFCPTDESADNLEKEGIDKKKIYVVGNTIVDAVKMYTKGFRKKKGDIILVTLHRQETVDDKNTLLNVVRGISKVQEHLNLDVIFPIHPRTKKRLEKFQIDIYKHIKNLRLMPPASFRFMLWLENNARIILTDSGGIQEEACILKVPCVTIRKTTERPETVDVKANIVSGTDPKWILKSAKVMLNMPRDWKNPYGDGYSAKRIVDILENEK